MANFYDMESFNMENKKILLSEPQLKVLLHILATQLCKMDEPRYGFLSLYGMPDGEEPSFVASAYMSGGDFRRGQDNVPGELLAVRSILAAGNFPDKDLHYTQTASINERLWSGVYFDDEDDFGVLVLTASHGQLLLSLQLSYTEDGEEYAQEYLLRAYATAVVVFQHMMPQDELLQSSCITALDGIRRQHSDCGCYVDVMEDLGWIQGSFERARQAEISQWKHWQNEHPEVKTYFKT